MLRSDADLRRNDCAAAMWLAKQGFVLGPGQVEVVHFLGGKELREESVGPDHDQQHLQQLETKF